MAQTTEKNGNIYKSALTARGKVLATATSTVRERARLRCLALYEKSYGKNARVL